MANEKRLVNVTEEIQAMYSLPETRRILETNSDARKIIDWFFHAPTVDAVEVVHGEWISLTSCANAGVYCSVCHKKVWKEDYAWCNRKNKLRSNYCPNCGAKMDGERKDNG